MSFLYHITKKKHLKRILKEGLLPGIKSRRVGLSINKKCKWDRIFLTDNVKYIINNQAGKDWMGNAIILKINIKHQNIKKHKTICPKVYDNSFIIDHKHEYVCYDRIDIKNIEVI